MINPKCAYCGKDITKKNINKNTKFCNSKCYHLSTRQSDEIFYENNYAYILLTKDNITKKVIFDIDDIEKIKQYKWHLHLRKRDMRYDVCTNTHGTHKSRKYINMPRFLLNYNNDLTIDHINQNTLDNRKENLRIVTIFQNNQNKKNNTSGKVGVTWNKREQTWHVMICNKNVGSFKNFEQAVQARIEAEKAYQEQQKR